MMKRTQWPLALSVGAECMNAAAFDALSEAGIRQVELSSGTVGPFFAALDFPHRARRIADLAEEHGVSVTSVHLPFGPFAEIDPASPAPGVREHLLNVQTQLLRAASDAGIRMAIVHPSGEPYGEEERQERLACAIDAVGRLCETAGSLGVALCLENLPRTCLCRTSDEMLRFLRDIPGLKVVFDTNHSLTEDNIHYIRAVGSRIASLHVSDYDRIDERHWLPGEGCNDWDGILSALEEAGYQGRFLYELCQGYSYGQIAANYRSLMA